MPYEYNAKVKDVVDGDTIVVDIDLGFSVVFFDQKVRLVGIDTPESRTSNKIEKHFGLASKEFVKKFVAECGKYVVIRTTMAEDTGDVNKEKFGRILGEIINPATKQNLNEELVKKNYAVKYLGENKLNVAEEHLKNRKILIDRGEVKLSYKEAGILP
jgi:micrococcal nuclease